MTVPTRRNKTKKRMSRGKYRYRITKQRAAYTQQLFMLFYYHFFSRWHTTHTLISLHFSRWTVQQTIWFQLAFTWFFTLYGHVCLVQGVYVKSFTFRTFSQSFDLSKLYIALMFSILPFYKAHVKQRSMNCFLEPSIFVSRAVKQ